MDGSLYSIPCGVRCGKLSGEIIAQVPAAGRMAQLAQGFGFDLADALARNVKVLSHLFQRMVLPVDQAKAQLQDFTLPVGEHCQGIFHRFAQHLTRRGVHGLQGIFVLDEIPQLAVLFVANRAFEGHGLFHRAA